MMRYSFLKKEKLIFIMPIMSTIFMTLFWCFEKEIWMYLGGIFYFIPVLFFDIDRLIEIYYLLLPNISLFKVDKDSMAFSSIFLIIFLLRFILKNRFKVNFDFKIVILLILYLVTSFTTYLLNYNEISLINADIRIVMDIILLYLIIKIYKNTIYDIYSKIENNFIIGTLVAAIGGVAFCIANEIPLMAYRLEAINSDPNYYGLCLAFSISLVLMKIYKNRYNKVDLLYIIILILFGLMTQSRGFLICMSFNYLIILYLSINFKKINLKHKLLIILGIITIGIIFKNEITIMYDNLIYRLTAEQYKGGSGRIDIWIEYINLTFSQIKTLLIGVGVPEHIPHVQHNIYLEAFTGKGLIGSFIIVSIYGYMYIYLKRNINVFKITVVSLLPILTLMIGFCFINGLVADIGIMTIFLGFFANHIYSRY